MASRSRFASPAEARAAAIEMVYQDLSLCDTVDVAGNLFLGREPTRALGLRSSTSGGCSPRPARMLDALEIHIPSLTALVEPALRRPAPVDRDRPRRRLRAASVLIMDEPTSALAVAEVEAVLRLIRPA